MAPYKTLDAAVVGGGPAGLRAAELLAGAGMQVALYDHKPSVGRKFLVAGRGGLNLTHSEERDAFISRYEAEPARWRDLLAACGSAELRAWAEGLGVETYVGTSGRVFPRGQQAASLLRRWVARLRTLGVSFHVAHRLENLRQNSPSGWQLDLRDLRTEDTRSVWARAVVLALGGASWPQTGSDGTWPDLLRTLGVPVAPWEPANCGFEVDWDARVLTVAEGLPLKNIAVSAGGRNVVGELLVTRYGLEGGALYQLGSALRTMTPPVLRIDFKPGVSADTLVSRIASRSLGNWAEIARAWRLSPAARFILEFQEQLSTADVGELARRVKDFPLILRGPRPVAEAISSAGGVAWAALNEDLMVAARPGLFVAGEMIDWEAPTGGYLLQGCFATGTRAGVGALAFLQAQPA